MLYAELGAYLVNAPLYRDEIVETPKITDYGTGDSAGNRWLHAPEVIDRECPTCGITRWRLLGGADQNRINRRVLSSLTYECRNCGKRLFHVWVMYWRTDSGEAYIMKAGQYPKLEVSVPPDFGRALGGKRSLYLKGMTLRHNAYGIGALTYFRRVIEETTDEMLDLLEAAMRETGADPAAINRLEDAKAGNRFEDKVKLAREVLPASLQPGGINPFGDLYSLLSIGLHGLSDEECCDIVDAMDQSLKFVYTQLKSHAEDARAYQSAVTTINQTVARLRQRAPNAEA